MSDWGASLSDKGKILNTVAGVRGFLLISKIMNLLSVSVFPKQIVDGVIVILAVLTQKLPN